ncbi:MAG TPA: wax ester/triacylglycerol synthase family O-acyltransferase [Candidatus Sulfopaludibacter sp.]|nr:wax ester/triacylglycerol synthase family O-acyltransferase [Candidatus Sulfopaludibacter sp.]
MSAASARAIAPGRRLSGVDAAFLYLERKEIPLHIAAVGVFEEPIPFDEFVRNIDSKLYLLPRYQQVVVSPPYDLGYPTWEPDPNFDITRHIFRVEVDPPGDEAALSALAGRILSTVMDRGKPLWDLYVVDGLRDGRGAMIARVHHSLADGVSGAALLKIMLDPSAEASRATGKARRRTPPPPAPEQTLPDALTSAVHSSLQNLIAAEAGMLDFAQSLLSDGMQAGLQELTALLPEFATPAQRLPFNKPCTGERLFTWAEFDFADLQAVRAKVGCKVNDVILTVLNRALVKYVKLHGESVSKRYLHVVCPVNIRSEEQIQALGNRITFMPVILPMNEPHPMRMLQAVAARTQAMKGARAAELVAIAASWLGAAPPPVQKLFWAAIPTLQLPVPLFNIICTNVPGSPVPLYCVGRRMVASYPQVPTGYELGVGCAAQSYNGKLFFGLTADSQAAPDVDKLRDFIKDAFGEVCRSAARHTKS